ncbi:MAG TPA: UbiA family prenyltransferase [Gemmatimonadaceae bacterium]
MSARSARALLEIARWENALIASVGVLFGAWWVGWGAARPIAFAILAALPLTAAANVWNDVADVEIDRRAHPERPLPSHRLDVRTARRFASLAALASVVFASAAAASLGALTVLVLALMFAYSPWIKRAGLAGNITVAALASLPFLYGAWAAGKPAQALLLVAIAAPLHLAREIAKDLEDATADAATRRTLPVTAGSEAAAAVLVASLIIFFLLLLPFIVARPLLGAALMPAAALIVYAVWCALRGRRGSPLAFKLAMLCAMGALVIVHP